jgi:hypothetical protein
MVHAMLLPSALTTCRVPTEENTMLWAIVVVLFLAWLVAFFAFHMTSGLIHLVLAAAVIALIVKLFSGPRVHHGRAF